MLEHLAQGQPQPSPSQPAPIDVHVDLSGLANLIWQSFLDHLGDVGAAIWQGIKDHLGEIAQTIWTPLSQWIAAGMQNAVVSVWDATFGALGNFLGRVPPEWTYDSPAYRAIATDPVPVAIGGATLAIVLLGLRTLVGSMVGRDHVITHISGRLIPAVFLTLAYPVLVVRGVQLLNAASSAIGTQAAVSTLVILDPSGITSNPALMLLWLLLLFYGLRLLLRVAYSMVRFVVALVFGPVAIILWAIPQTEWVTWFWLRELVGWGTTPLLVTVALAIAVPLATGHSGFLAAAAFGVAGFQAAYDLVGVLGLASQRHAGMNPVAYMRPVTRMGGGAGVAAASIPANRVTTLADMYGYH